MALALSSINVLISAVFTAVVFRQWIQRRKLQQLLWSFALLVWTIAVAAELSATIQGEWTAFTYRIYYAFGALMVAPWLGAGSLFLIASRRLAKGFTIFVAALSLVGVSLIVAFAVDVSQLTFTDSLGFVEVKIFPLIPVRLLIIIGNALGSVAFVGSALYSVWSLRRRDVPRQLTIGVLLIGVGGLVAATAHSLGALGGPGLFRVSELAAISLIFGGYVLSTFFVRSRSVAPQPS